MDKIISYFLILWETFRWWSFLLVGITFVVMIPVNLLICKVFSKISNKNEEATKRTDRLRKSISSIMVFGIAAVVITIFSLVHKDVLSAPFVFSNTLIVAPLAMFFRALWKIIRDYGFKPVVAVIWKSKEGQALLKKLNIDKAVAKNIINYIDTFLSESKGDELERIIESELVLTNDISVKLGGFTEDAYNAAKTIIQHYKDKYSKS